MGSTFTVITRKILARVISSNFLWALSGLLATAWVCSLWGLNWVPAGIRALRVLFVFLLFFCGNYVVGFWGFWAHVKLLHMNKLGYYTGYKLPCRCFRLRLTSISMMWSFLSRVSILLLTRDIDIAILSVRPSVRLSVTRWYCMKAA